ncbi:hypothetical protein WA158_000155 [Blastocystis sp. Blastoise]
MEEFTAIVVTAANAKQAAAYQIELEVRQKKGLIAKNTLILAVPDPSSARVGSGGATFNALVAATERLSARKGYASISPDILSNSKIAIIHSGGDSRRSPCQSLCGKAWSAVNAENEGNVMTPFDFLLLNLSQLFAGSPPGIIVCSSDVLLKFDASMKYDWSMPGVTGVGIPMDIEYGTRHGVFVPNEDGTVANFFQKASCDFLRENGAVVKEMVNGVEKELVYLDSGVVFFDANTTQILVNIHLYPPLDACTYMGVDGGATPLRIELYSDIMEALGSSPITYDEYLNSPTSSSHIGLVKEARSIFWKHLRKIQFNVATPKNSSFVHVGTTKETVALLTTPNTEWYQTLNLKPVVESYIENPENCEGAVIINSLLTREGTCDEGCVIEHSKLTGNYHIGRGAFVSQIRTFSDICIGDNVACQEIQLYNNLLHANSYSGLSAIHDDLAAQRDFMSVLLVYGVKDNIKGQYNDPKSTFCGKPWSEFLSVSGLSPNKIWPDVPENDRCIWFAKVFPLLHQGDSPYTSLWMQDIEHASQQDIRTWRTCERISLSDILNQGDSLTSFDWRRKISLEIGLKKMSNILINKEDECILPFIKKLVADGAMIDQAFCTLDELASTGPLDTVPRVLSTIADLLAELSAGNGGLRSGPARNPDWEFALNKLRIGDRVEAVSLMASLREEWLDSPERMVRAARHYEAAAQLLVSQVIFNCTRSFRRVTPPSIGTWVTATAPIRADLAGGWTDTPPITYELKDGGMVINVAIKLDGQYPILASARRLKDSVLVLQPPENTASSPMVWRTLDDIKDYHQPLAPGALFKCGVIALGLVNMNSGIELYKQLDFNVGGGIEVRMSSNLPQGSGLGTSSILAGALLAAICSAVGYEYDADTIFHSVLILEQLLTTGGGWQDQVGGLLPGFKYSVSPDKFPVNVDSSILDVKEDVVKGLNDRFIFVYTGRQRLARSLLQDVIRHWYAREETILHAVKGLQQNTLVCKDALEEGDIKKIGECMTTYWNQKKVMAPQSEPLYVKNMIDSVKEDIYGYTLAGAGGGGFLILLTKEANQLEKIQEKIRAVSQGSDVSFYKGEIDTNGLLVTIGDKPIGNPLVAKKDN